MENSKNSTYSIDSETLKKTTILHNQAMDLAEEAFFLNRKKLKDEAKAKFEQAFQHEKEVADIFIEQAKTDLEPSRSTLVLSAAALARDAGLTKECDHYASKVIEYNFDSYFVQEALSLKSKESTS